MTKVQNTVEEVTVDWRKIDREVRAGQAEMARVMGAWIASSVRRVIKAPAALFGARVATS